MVADVQKTEGFSSNSPLGSDRKIRVPKLPSEADKPIESTTEYRYRIQTYARALIWKRDMRLYYCQRRSAPGCSTIEVRRNTETTSAHFAGLEQCNRVWTCPVCAVRISNQRRKEISEALAAAKLRGYQAVLVTYTLRHDGSDRLQTLLDALLGALRKFKSGRAYQDIKSEFSVLGGIRALEPTFGEYGWHPHVHEVLILEKPISPMETSGLRKWLTERWIAMLNKIGFDASFAHGLDVQTADSKIADYIAKYGREPGEKEWGVEHEIASAPSKRAHKSGLTPFQLLESYGAGDHQAGELFDEYARCMEGRRQLVWSAGLRALLELPEELADEQLPLLEETPATYTAVQFDQENWYNVLMTGCRGAILFLVAAGDWTTLEALFRKYDIHATIHREPPAIPVMCNPQPVIRAADGLPENVLLFQLPAAKVRYE